MSVNGRPTDVHIPPSGALAQLDCSGNSRPAGESPGKVNSGGHDHCAATPKRTVPPENSAWGKRAVPPENSASAKRTVPPENLPAEKEWG